MVAAALVLLVAVDTFLTGLMLARQAAMQKVLEVVGDIQQTHTGEIELLRNEVNICQR